MKKILAVTVLAFIVVGCGEKESSPEMTEIKLQRMARDHIKSTLKDPKSAEFRNQMGTCGEVNAKNSFGAYTGFKRFITNLGDITLMDGDGALPISEFNKIWNDFCPKSAAN